MSNEGYLNESLRKIAKGAGIGFIGAFIGMAFGYFSRIVIARFLGPGDYGLITLGIAGMSIAATLSLLGLPSGIQRFVSFYKGKGDEGKIKGTILGALTISFPLSLFLAILIFIGADWVSIHVFHEPHLTPVLKIFALAIPFSVCAQNLVSSTIGFQDLRYKVYVNDLFQNTFKLVAIVTLFLLEFGVFGAVWGWVLAIILTPFLALYFLDKKLFPVFKSKIKSVHVEKELFSFSWPLIFVSAAGLIIGWTDTLMLGYFSNASDVGIYNVALPTAMLVMNVTVAFSMIFLPVASELYARNKIDDLRKAYSAVTKWVFSLTLPIFLLMALFSKSIIQIIFGSEYIFGAMALSILVAGFFIDSATGPVAHITLIYGRTKINMGCSFIGAGTNFTLNFLLIPIYGIEGAAIATASSYILMKIALMISAYRISGMQPYKLSYFKPFIASVIAVMIVYVLTKYFIGVSFLVLAVMFFVFLLLYFFLLLLFKSFEKEDLMIMRAIDERLGTKSEWAREIIKKFL
jgi:O-antigen/teichoic acid export membrane protein